MDWLIRLPVVGPVVGRLMRTHAWRSYETLDRAHWNRLAAAITFISFLALFPLITVGAVLGAALLSEKQLDEIQRKISEQVPGISDQLDVNALVANAGTVGLVAGAILLFTGIGWVGSMRDCLRAVWDADDEDEGNPFLRKAKDAVVLLGLGATALGSLAASALGSTAVGWSADRLGVDHDGAGGVLLQIAALLVGALADFLLLLYLLTLLPGVHPPRRRLVVAGVIGAVGFELLKLLLGGYMRGVAAKSMYGAFGVPVALLLWLNFTARLLLFCAAWTATGSQKDEAGGDEDDDEAGGDDDGDGDGEGEGDGEDARPEEGADGTKGAPAAPPAASAPGGAATSG